MNFLPHIAQLNFNSPLLIDPRKHEVIMHVLGEQIGIMVDGNQEPPSPEMVKPSRKASFTKQPQIAVVPILGSLVHRSFGLDAMSGIQSYQEIRRDFRAALADPDVGAILLDIESAGGAALGVADLADEIFEAREKKRIYAYANQYALSAAYFLAAPAHRVFTTRTSSVGSIGVRYVHVDMTKFDEKAGFKYTTFYEGDRKNDFDPHSVVTEEAKQELQRDMRELYDLFVESVARYRGMKAEDVRATQAAVYQGRRAVDVGLADDVLTFDEVIETISSDLETHKPKGARVWAPSKEKEVSALNELAQLKAENPDLYALVMDQAKAEIKKDLQASFDAEKESLAGQIKDLKGELTSKDERILKLEKSEFIRTKREKQTRVDSAAETIWVKALAGSDIPEDMHEKVRAMVKPADYLKDEELDAEAFQAAVDSEIDDWEGKGMTTSILGSGKAGRSATDNADLQAQQQEEKDDDAWVDNMLALGGQKEKGGDE